MGLAPEYVLNLIIERTVYVPGPGGNWMKVYVNVKFPFPVFVTPTEVVEAIAGTKGVKLPPVTLPTVIELTPTGLMLLGTEIVPSTLIVSLGGAVDGMAVAAVVTI
jgi:hypothetical protein